MFGLREQEIYTLIIDKKANEKNKKNDGSKTVAPVNSISSFELMFLKVLLHYPLFLEKIREDDIVTMLQDKKVQKIVDVCIGSNLNDTAAVINNLSDTESQKIVSELLLSSEDIENELIAEQIFEQSFKRIKLSSIKRQQRKIKSKLKSSINKEPEFEIELLKEYDNLVKMEKSLSEQVYGA